MVYETYHVVIFFFPKIKLLGITIVENLPHGVVHC